MSILSALFGWVKSIDNKFPRSSLVLSSVGCTVMPFMAALAFDFDVIKFESEYRPFWITTFKLMGVLGVFIVAARLLLEIKFGRLSSGRPKGEILASLLPPDDAEERIISLDAAYDRWAARYGIRRARRIYCIQAFGAVLGFWIDWLLRKSRFLDLVEKWLTKPSS